MSSEDREEGAAERENEDDKIDSVCVCGWESVSMNMYVSIYT